MMISPLILLSPHPIPCLVARSSLCLSKSATVIAILSSSFFMSIILFSRSFLCFLNKPSFL
uniref:Uncharacterized protein n=1 Tax=Anguilla anguilla TaxID=7936 RepID=A0A0E9REB1_ANGAN